MRGVILLDRDGVLNPLCVDTEHGLIDSPLNVDQVEVYPYVPAALKKLCDAGFKLAVVTNQPAAAKGKTTQENLDAVLQKVIALCESDGAVIEFAMMCPHKREDACVCRKPKATMLTSALTQLGATATGENWMVGDGVTDVQAGHLAKVKTAFLFPHKIEYEKVFAEKKAPLPSLWCENLENFVDQII